MRVHRSRLLVSFYALLPAVLLATATPQPVQAANGLFTHPDVARIIQYWTAQRRAQAIPRDLVVDTQGFGYLRQPDGTLKAYGDRVGPLANAVSLIPLRIAALRSRRGSGGDSTPPSISNMAPTAGEVIGASRAFSATVTDASGVRSVTFVIQYPNSTQTQSFSASKASSGDSWSLTLQGFTNGSWAWWVVAKDAASLTGNTATSATVHFSVDTGGSASTGGDTVTDAHWASGGAVQTASGRLYFEMPSSSRWRRSWIGYVCSGSVVSDGVSGRSVILTAAHCVYDDAHKAFARNVLFIPDQNDTTGTGTDLNCGNDPLGCWTPSFGAVDTRWTATTFPNNIPWDYGYYVVQDSGAHLGTGVSSDVLDTTAGSLPLSFTPPYHDDGAPGKDSVDFTYSLGYSYSEDPNLIYCAEDMTTNGAWDWWLPSCGLSGGSSGGPWIQPMDTSSGSGPVIAINSWGYTNSPGMAGTKLSGSSAECVFVQAKATDWLAVSSTDGKAGVAVTCP